MKDKTVKIAESAICIACGILLPLLFHMVGLGKFLLPMHIPVIIGAMLLGSEYGFLIGLATPLLSALLTGMPPLAPPVAAAMMCELGIAGALAGFLYRAFGRNIYFALVTTILAGRIVWGIAGYFMLPLLGMKGVGIFYPLTYGLATCWPGIALQIVVVPLVIYAIEQMKGRRAHES